MQRKCPLRKFFFFASCTLTSKGALRLRRHSGRKAEHYISRIQSKREASYLSLIHLSKQGRERKWTVNGGHDGFSNLMRRSKLFYLLHLLWRTPSPYFNSTRAILEELLGSYSILSTTPIDEVFRFRSILRCNRFDPLPQ